MKIKNLLVFALLFLALSGFNLSVNAQTIKLLKDINLAGSSSTKSYMTEYNGKLYISADDGVNGYELWVSDSTETGTHLLKDINPGSAASNAGSKNFAVCNGELFFFATDGTHGYELWVTDGTEAGTTMVKDINVGSSTGTTGYMGTGGLYVYNGKVYFKAKDAATGIELWCSDGTEAGTTLVKDILPGTGGSNPGTFREYNGNLYFVASDGIHGSEVWLTDGTEAGTHLLKDINTSEYSDMPGSLTVFNKLLYFSAIDNTDHGKELWVTDGTEAGTHMVKDIIEGKQGSNPQYLIVCNGMLYFNAQTNDSYLDSKLWKTDGTSEGTVVVDPGALLAMNPSIPIAYNGKLFFMAYDGPRPTGYDINYELWESNGTAEGTTKVKEINPSSTIGSVSITASSEGFVEYHNKLYFRADDGNGKGIFLWQTDGTTEGTIKVNGQDTTLSNPLGSSGFTFKTYKGSLYYAASYNDVVDFEVYKLTTATAPKSFDVKGGGSYCQLADGLSVGLSGSEAGVSYILYKDNIAQLPTVEGTGDSISFGLQLFGTYIVSGTNAGGTTQMIGNALLTETAALPVSVTVAADFDTICGGNRVIYMATPANGGGEPVYQWYKNGVLDNSDHSSWLSYVTPFVNDISQDSVYVVMTSDIQCASNNPAKSNVEALTILPSRGVDIHIVSDKNNVCEGSPVTFTATSQNGGTAPSYYWFVNEINVGTNQPTYTYMPANGDVVYVNMSSNLPCAIWNPGQSNSIYLTVVQPLTPRVSIAASANPVDAGTLVRFTPTPENGGTTTYQWFVNGIAAGTGDFYEYVPQHGDEVYSIMTSALDCVTSAEVTSNVVTINLYTGIDYAAINGFKVYCSDKVIHIENSKGFTGEVSVFDMAGRRLFTRKVEHGTKTLIPVSSITDGIYLVKVTSNNNQFSTKVLIN